MNRIEFIDTLRSLLSEELPRDKVEENIRYYDEYIRAAGDESSQNESIDTIGDPHLIAQTIIDSYKMSGEYKYTGGSGQNYYSQQSQKDSESYNSNEESEEVGKSIWKTIRNVAIITTVVIVLFVLIRFAFAVFIRVGLPLIACYCIIKLIRGFMDK